MKKLIVFLVTILALTGCSLGKDMNNTPTKKVEAYLDSYQTLDDNILNDLDTIIDDTKYTIEQQSRYKELMKKHYQNLKYEIKEETINGDKATVTTEIEVVDYSKILSETPDESQYLDEEGNYDATLFYDYQLGKMEEAKETVKYNVTFYLTKVDDEWSLDALDETTKEKIHGIYIY